MRAFLGRAIRNPRTTLRRFWFRFPPVRRWLRRNAQRAWEGRTIAFVCFGNICRSPFAERIAGQHLHHEQVAVSAGYFPEADRRSPELAVMAADRHGVDLRSHRSKVITTELVESADAIFVFDHENYRTIVGTYPSAKRRVHLLGALSEEGSLVVPDPFGGAVGDYELVYQRITELIGRNAPGGGRHASGR
jgi:protein-tyrosine-phosphatase